jgi:integrase
LIDAIEPRDVVEIQNKIRDRGAPILANRVRSCLSSLFRFAVEQALLAKNPCTGLSMPAPEKSRERYLDEGEIRRLWTELESEAPRYKVPFRLMLLLRVGPVKCSG